MHLVHDAVVALPGRTSNQQVDGIAEGVKVGVSAQELNAEPPVATAQWWREKEKRASVVEREREESLSGGERKREERRRGERRV
jgi:Fe-S cluster assembly ATPase SufC